MTADPQGRLAQQAVQRYVERTSRQDYEGIAALFAPDALVITSDGSIVRGRENIASLYREHLETTRPTTRILREVISGGDCWIELGSRRHDEDDFHLAASDHFTVGEDGLIRRLAVFPCRGRHPVADIGDE